MRWIIKLSETPLEHRCGVVLRVLTRGAGLIGSHERHLAWSGIKLRRRRYRFPSANAVNNCAVFFARPR